jgi:hypothetical protein
MVEPAKIIPLEQGGPVPPFKQAEATPGASWVRPYVYRDPTTIPPRAWLYGNHHIRQYLTLTVSPGGVGKSALALVEALAMVTGRPLLGTRPVERELRVWYFNGEDPPEETERRVAAAMLFYGISPEEVEGRLFLGSGRDEGLIVAERMGADVEVCWPNIDALQDYFRTNRIDVAILDPFITTHRVPENDNGAIGMVAAELAALAGRANVAMELVHHVRKGTPGTETTVEDGRGAGALLAAARSARALNGMTEGEAISAGIEPERRPFYFRCSNGKANLAPPPASASWYHLTSQALGNGTGLYPDGDSVGVATAWEWPNHLAGLRTEDLVRVQAAVGSGEWRENVQARAWVGYCVADTLGMDASAKHEKAKIKGMVRRWLDTGALRIERRTGPKREPVDYVVAGEPVSLEVETFQ